MRLQAAVSLLLGLVACSAHEGGDTAPPPDTGAAETPFQLSFPVDDPAAIAPPVIGVDHDPEVHEGIDALICTNYAGLGFPHCYDEHHGSDFLLDGGFDAMDAGSAWVLAAAPGTVVEVEDGHYDRCHGDLATMDVSCDGHEVVGNHVIVAHDSGYRVLYWHFMKDSIDVAVGDVLSRGDPLGRIGSSGYSTTPHLHLELQDPDGEVIDPYAGDYSQPESWWCAQGDVDGLPGDCP